MWSDEQKRELDRMVDSPKIDAPRTVLLIAARDEITRSNASEAELLALLRGLEWPDRYCALCNHHEEIGHAADCRLAAALAKGERT